MLQALILSHNRPLPHCYKHSQYHITEHCHIGKGLHSITLHCTATLVQALTVHTTKHNKIGTGTDSITQKSTGTLEQRLRVSHNRTLPHWDRQRQYQITVHCHIGTGTRSITQQHRPLLSSYTTFFHIILKASTKSCWSWFFFFCSGL
jgi:hypothetical protein